MGKVLLRLLTLFVLYTGMMGCSEVVCMENVPEEFVLSEEVAIDLTRMALQRDGVETRDLTPIPYWDTSPAVFARSDSDPVRGYVLWGKEKHARFSVAIRKSGGKIYCKPSKTK